MSFLCSKPPDGPISYSLKAKGSIITHSRVSSRPSWTHPLSYHTFSCLLPSAIVNSFPFLSCSCHRAFALTVSATWNALMLPSHASSPLSLQTPAQRLLHLRDASLTISYWLKPSLPFYFFKILFIFREGKGGGEKHKCMVASHAPPTEDLACNPGMCPDWESDWWPFGLQASAQSTEPHQPGLNGLV